MLRGKGEPTRVAFFSDLRRYGNSEVRCERQTYLPSHPPAAASGRKTYLPNYLPVVARRRKELPTYLPTYLGTYLPPRTWPCGQRRPHCGWQQVDRLFHRARSPPRSCSRRERRHARRVCCFQAESQVVFKARLVVEIARQVARNGSNLALRRSPPARGGPTYLPTCPARPAAAKPTYLPTYFKSVHTPT